MKTWTYALALIAVSAATAAWADTNELARPRKWTSASGAELMAVFVQLSENGVVLRNRTGERIQISRDKLSAADQALLDAAFGPVVEAPPLADEFGAPPPAAAGEPERALPVQESPPAAPAAGPAIVAGTEIRLGGKTTFRAPLDKEAIQALSKAGNNATEAAVGLWVPADFDPQKEWKILLVSQTADASSVDHMDCYPAAVQTAPGWIMLAADGPFAPPKGDTTQWRWQMARAGLQALEAAWPASRNWPIAAGGFSGGAKRSGFLGALLCADGRNLIGMYMGGCNQDMASEGLKDYRPDRVAFRKVPVYLSAGKQDATAPVQKVDKVRLSLEATGFREVRMETYDGGHNPDLGHVAEALNWFEELRAKRAAPASGARTPTRLPAPSAPPIR
ncbi:MAG: hypothetical protein AB7V14_00345 [Kiritimatiellia bacterium]